MGSVSTTPVFKTVPFLPPIFLLEDADSLQRLEGIDNVRPSDRYFLLPAFNDDAGRGRFDIVLFEQEIVTIEGGFSVKDRIGDPFFLEDHLDLFFCRDRLIG